MLGAGKGGGRGQGDTKSLCMVLCDNARYHMVHIPWYKAGCDTNRCAWYCVVLYGTMQSIVWYCLISCGVVSERGKGRV